MGGGKLRSDWDSADQYGRRGSLCHEKSTTCVPWTLRPRHAVRSSMSTRKRGRRRAASSAVAPRLHPLARCVIQRLHGRHPIGAHERHLRRRSARAARSQMSHSGPTAAGRGLTRARRLSASASLPSLPCRSRLCGPRQRRPRSRSGDGVHAHSSGSRSSTARSLRERGSAPARHHAEARTNG